MFLLDLESFERTPEMVSISSLDRCGKEEEREQREREREWEILQRLIDVGQGYSGAIKVEFRIPCSGVFYSTHFTP